ncbi:hypothetical protein T492DRAFT_1151237 [Pavlovales sp. CCMP2436]|nr:hypothetical protein T492DRAFT_1151237 [Pavlovales sp. CCMP2436]
MARQFAERALLLGLLACPPAGAWRSPAAAPLPRAASTFFSRSAVLLELDDGAELDDGGTELDDRPELSTAELYDSLRRAVDAVPDPQLRRELRSDAWERARNKVPLSSEFLEAMRELQDERNRRIHVRFATALGAVVGLYAVHSSLASLGFLAT